MKTNRLRRTAVMAAMAACALALTNTALGVGDVVISQVWGGSSTLAGAAALPKADYIELFNRTASPVSLNGWSINVDTSTGTSWTKHDLPNVSIPAFSYYLIQVSATSTAGVDLPTPDTTFAAPTFTELT
jgi:predicted extracellular nuclease